MASFWLILSAAGVRAQQLRQHTLKQHFGLCCSWSTNAPVSSGSRPNGPLAHCAYYRHTFSLAHAAAITPLAVQGSSMNRGICTV